MSYFIFYVKHEETPEFYEKRYKTTTYKEIMKSGTTRQQTSFETKIKSLEARRSVYTLALKNFGSTRLSWTWAMCRERRELDVRSYKKIHCSIAAASFLCKGRIHCNACAARRWLSHFLYKSPLKSKFSTFRHAHVQLTRVDLNIFGLQDAKI